MAPDAFQDETTVARELNLGAIFCNYRPPDELFLGNSASFQSALVKKTREEWNIRLRILLGNNQASGADVTEFEGVEEEGQS